MGGMILEESKRKAERQAGAHLIDRVSVREGPAKSDVETEIIANLPDKAD
jgi:hypothetical protein